MYIYVKRFLDIIISLLLLAIISPLLLFIVIIIKLDSKGSPFFLQERMGYEGSSFKIIKFRTMVLNAENIGDGLSIKASNDKRITKTGNFLRKTSLDELPQLVNVLKGDMSLIGPRPPVLYHPYDGFNNYPDKFKKRFSVKPGITGLAQVKLRNSGTWDERMVYDVKYVETLSFYNDVNIFFLTIVKVVKRENVY